jgi:hypothetical protein
VTHNPPAFPREDYQADDAPGQRGMSLRDWFAGQVIGAVLTAMNREPEFTKNPERSLTLSAKGAYMVADAMLAERAKGAAK